MVRSVYHKTIIGINNSCNTLMLNPVEVQNLADSARENYEIVGNVFPPDIRNEIRSELRERTVLIVIEIAYQYPDRAHVMHISKSLDIPFQTVSKEIKKLVELQYVRQEINKSNLADARYKYYGLTSKGVLFLHLLKETLNITILTMKKEDLGDDLYPV